MAKSFQHLIDVICDPYKPSWDYTIDQRGIGSVKISKVQVNRYTANRKGMNA
jgi:hypothetical protein